MITKEKAKKYEALKDKGATPDEVKEAMQSDLTIDPADIEEWVNGLFGEGNQKPQTIGKTRKRAKSPDGNKVPLKVAATGQEEDGATPKKPDAKASKDGHPRFDLYKVSLKHSDEGVAFEKDKHVKSVSLPQASVDLLNEQSHNTRLRYYPAKSKKAVAKEVDADDEDQDDEE